MPFLPGSPISIRTIVGGRLATFSTASSPLFAIMKVHSGKVTLSQSCNELHTTSLSSTIKMVCFISNPLKTIDNARPLKQGQLLVVIIHRGYFRLYGLCLSIGNV